MPNISNYPAFEMNEIIRNKFDMQLEKHGIMLYLQGLHSGIYLKINTNMKYFSVYTII